MNSVASQKKALRARLLAQRNELPPETVRRDSIAATRRFLDDVRVARAGCMLLYLPLKNELDTRDIFTELASRGVTVLLPRCRDGEAGELDLFRVTCLDEVRPGRFGILEPDPGLCRPAGETPPDVATVPGMAFDHRGFRLGFGGGYYDRLFTRPVMARTLRIGLAYDFQVVDRLPAEAWDQPMHAVCTPKEMTWISP
ncbi:5-formyltetrahydrofolate cyclo-ligase [Desulfolutivibrio sp.]|uniref:5-formyltetrahydrofolate cyclo-ligase n=1 Tax=Desulfolutivibrio sp. TaxID=2773296 RepID=UPI002F964A6A